MDAWLLQDLTCCSSGHNSDCWSRYKTTPSQCMCVHMCVLPSRTKEQHVGRYLITLLSCEPLSCGWWEVFVGGYWLVIRNRWLSQQRYFRSWGLKTGKSCGLQNVTVFYCEVSQLLYMATHKSSSILICCSSKFNELQLQTQIETSFLRLLNKFRNVFTSRFYFMLKCTFVNPLVDHSGNVLLKFYVLLYITRFEC